jgi:hypothetical protein
MGPLAGVRKMLESMDRKSCGTVTRRWCHASYGGWFVRLIYRAVGRAAGDRGN